MSGTVSKKVSGEVASSSNGDPAEKMEKDREYTGVAHPIRLLEGRGITAGDIEKLKEAGLYTVEAVAYKSKRELLRIKGISEAKADKLKNESKMLVPMGFTTAASLHEKRAEIIMITTGSKELNKLLGGGIETSAITEIAGFQLRVSDWKITILLYTCGSLSDLGGAEGKCLWIDTDGTFRPELLLGPANRFKLSPSEVLENVGWARAYNTEQMHEQLGLVAGLMAESRYGLLVVDCATSLFRVEYDGRGELQPRQSSLNKFMRALLMLADQFGIAVVVTNQVTAVVDGLSFQQDPKKAIGGNIMGHSSTTRLFLRKGKEETRICRVYSAQNLAEAEASFVLTSEGLDDVKEK